MNTNREQLLDILINAFGMEHNMVIWFGQVCEDPNMPDEVIPQLFKHAVNTILEELGLDE